MSNVITFKKVVIIREKILVILVKSGKRLDLIDQLRVIVNKTNPSFLLIMLNILSLIVNI